MSLKRPTQEYVLTEAKIDAVKANISKIASGSYTGNTTANRAIAHGLGVAPRLVFVTSEHIGFMSHFMIYGNNVRGVQNTTEYVATVTAMDATNFYIGDTTYKRGNVNPGVYNWVAFA